MKINKILLIILIILPIKAFPEVCLTDEEAIRITQRLEKDKQIIKWQAKRWKDLVNTTPKINYKVLDNNQILIQTIEFKIKHDTPLIYETKSKINIEDVLENKYFPITPSLVGILETGTEGYGDAKFGIEVFSFSPMKKEIQKFSLHALIGIQSSGISVSFKIFEFLKNTRIHLYSGLTYTANKTFGTGISLNF